MGIPATHQGGDIFLWAYRFDEGCAESLVAKPLAPNLAAEAGWVWAHFTLSDQRGRAFVQSMAALPNEARALLLGEECGPRVLFSGAWAYGVMPDFEIAFDGKTIGVGRLRFAFDETRFVSLRRHALQISHEMHRRIEIGAAAPKSPIEAFAGLNAIYCEIAEDQLDDIAERLNHIEDCALAENSDLQGLRLGPLRQDLSRRHREIVALRTAYHRAIARHGQTHALAAVLPNLLQQTEDVHHEVTALQDRARLTHEEIDTRINAATNRTLHALTVMTALLMPPTLIVGAFGMNLDGIAFAHDKQGFALACGLCVVAVGAVYILLRRMRILH